MDKTYPFAAAAVATIVDGSAIAVGGFGLCGIPSDLVGALLDAVTSRLHVVSNNCGVDDGGLGVLLAAGRIDRMMSSYVGENKEFARQYLAGALEAEFVPQGTPAERLRDGGSGIPAFFTPAGAGTLVAVGGLPWRYAADGSVAVASPPRETRDFDGIEHILEDAVTTEYALVRAAVGDTHGNLVFHSSDRNFNPLAAMAGRANVAEVEQLVPAGALERDAVHLAGIFVQPSRPGCRSWRQENRQAHHGTRRHTAGRSLRWHSLAKEWPPARRWSRGREAT